MGAAWAWVLGECFSHPAGRWHTFINGNGEASLQRLFVRYNRVCGHGSLFYLIHSAVALVHILTAPPLYIAFERLLNAAVISGLGCVLAISPLLFLSLKTVVHSCHKQFLSAMLRQLSKNLLQCVTKLVNIGLTVSK